MRLPVAAACVALALTACSPSADLPLGTAAAAQFHQQLNAGQFDAVYSASTPAFKASTTPTAIAQMLSAVHRKLGQFKSGTTTGWNDTINTNGHILAMQMQSQYDHGAATESFSFEIANGKATLYGFNINSMALITN